MGEETLLNFSILSYHLIYHGKIEKTIYYSTAWVSMKRGGKQKNALRRNVSLPIQVLRLAENESGQK
jgi:hypothetical protein